MTYRTDRKGFVADDLHFTIDIKDSAMIENGTHLTVHGYIAVQSATNQVINMFNMNRIVPKQDDKGAIKIEKDQYYDPRKNKIVNNWDIATLKAFDEPDELSLVRLGDNFITVLSEEEAKTGGGGGQEAVEEALQVREALKQEGNLLLEQNKPE